MFGVGQVPVVGCHMDPSFPWSSSGIVELVNKTPSTRLSLFPGCARLGRLCIRNGPSTCRAVSSWVTSEDAPTGVLGIPNALRRSLVAPGKYLFIDLAWSLSVTFRHVFLFKVSVRVKIMGW